MHRNLVWAGKARGKKKTYLAITAVMLLLLAITAILLLHRASERRTEDYTRKARESYSAGDYENALLYLRRVKDEDENTEILLLMADCYEALENYPRALETLRKLNTADPAISNRIQSIEQRKLQQTQARMVTIAGVELSVNDQSAALEGLGLNDAQLQQLTVLYALDHLSLKDNQISDLTALGELKGLDELDLSGNQIRDIRALTKLESLRTLNLDRNPLTDCTELRSLRFLTSLSIVDTGVEEAGVYTLAKSLPDCSIRFGTSGAEKLYFTGEVFPLNAVELALGQKNLSDISMLQGFTELKILNLSDNDISDIRPLMELSKLEKLNINNNAVSDLRPLIGLPNLVKLEAENNRITETTSVGSVRQLTELNLRGNPIKDFSG
ncbi:MAG: leucine-rich repeat domain-containing protein, partial [Oscillospiraceae bacterium]|nr:leucine-rich repeat domain-containing protein [Oscillospiraceae bacterium]